VYYLIIIPSAIFVYTHLESFVKMSSGLTLKVFKLKNIITVSKTSNFDPNESSVGSLQIKKQKLYESQSTENYNVSFIH